MNIDKMREEFQSWWLHGVYPLRRMDRFEDAGVSEELAQEIWQDSRESIVIELPALENSSSYHDGADQRDAKIIECRKAIEAAGLKVKS